MDGTALKILREYNALNKTELARLIDCGKCYVTLYENSKKPSLKFIKKYARLFNIDKSEIFILSAYLELKRAGREYPTELPEEIKKVIEWYENAQSFKRDKP